MIESKYNGIVNIYNVIGKLVFTTIKNQEKLEISDTNLKKGIYLIEFNRQQQKIIIK